ncbi:hypothetical protein G7054_g443 [Neopestalotiopsis clavispora]|nr:hypothetical protein G7054_g443 [Neopestalotiopsis clavispora]
MEARGFPQGVIDADADHIPGLQGPQVEETGWGVPENDDDVHCNRLTYVTEISLKGWFFPGPWVDGHMESARYCHKAQLGFCDSNHLHVSVVDVDGERADFIWDMDKNLIHAPMQQVQLAAVIVMESSAEANSDLERHVANCTATNIDERISLCNAPFCPSRDHPVLVDPTSMGTLKSHMEKEVETEEADLRRLPWVLPTVIPGWPMKIQIYRRSVEETLDSIWELLEHDTGYFDAGVFQMNAPAFPVVATCNQLSSMGHTRFEETAMHQIVIHVGHDIVKDIEAWQSNQRMKDDKGQRLQRYNSVPKRVYDVKTGQIVPCQSDTEYAALSYVWAQHSNKTTLLTIKKLSDQLNMRYWWVDRLCMRTEEEKVEEIPRMAGYYQNARTTVVFDRGLASTFLKQTFYKPGSESTYWKVPIQVNRSTWNKADLDDFSGLLKSAVANTTWARRIWTLQEFILASRVLFVTNSGLVEGYLFGSWAAGNASDLGALYFRDAPWFSVVYDSDKCELQREIVKPRFGFMDGEPIGPSNYTWPRPALKPQLSLGAAWMLARGRQCTHKEDLVYGMATLLRNNEKILIEYNVSWTELIRRCCQWGLVEADVLTSKQTCSELGMCWAPDACDHNVPSLLDEDFIYRSDTLGVPSEVQMTLSARGLGCEVNVPQLEVHGGLKAGHGDGTWGALEFEGTLYSSLFTRGSISLDNMYCSALVVGVRERRWLFLVLLQQVGSKREIFHKIGTCHALINEDEDDLPLQRIANMAKKAIVMSGLDCSRSMTPSL